MKLRMLFDKAVEMAQKLADALLLANGRLALAKLLLLSRKESIETVLTLLNQAQEIFVQFQNLPGESLVLEQLGFALVQQGEYEEGRVYTQRFIEMASEQKNFISLSVGHENMGISFIKQGEISKATEHFQKSLQIAKEHDYLPGVILASSDLAGAFWFQGAYSEALRYLQQALQTAKEIGYKESLCLTVGNAGSVYQFLGNRADALFCFQQALQLAIEIGDIPNTVTFVYNIAFALANSGQIEQAKNLANYVIEKAAALKLTYLQCHCLNLLADVHFKQQNWHASRDANQKAIELANETTIQDILLKTKIRAILLQERLGEIEGQTAVSHLTTLIEEWTQPDEQAGLFFEITQLEPKNKQANKKAASLFKTAYTQSPNATYQKNYKLLTGKQLPPPPPLPKPEKVVAHLEEIGQLLQRFTKL